MSMEMEGSLPMYIPQYPQELHNIMKKFQFNASEEDVNVIIKNIDTDGNGTIELHEFLNFISRYNIPNEVRPASRRKTETT